MKVILLTLGSAGDVHPFVGLGTALMSRGHLVTIATNEYFKPLIERYGLGFIGIGDANDYLEITENPDIWHPRKGSEIVFKHIVLRPLRRVYEILRDFSAPDTVAAASCLMFGARMAQEKTGIPLATVYLQPGVIWSLDNPPIYASAPYLSKLPFLFKRIALRTIERFVIDRMFAPEMNAFRFEIGLPSINKILSEWIYSPQKVIGLFPEWYASPAPDWPQINQVGFVSFDTGEGELPPKVDRFIESGEPPVIFTPGTAMRFAAGFFKESIDACNNIGRRAILITRHIENVPSKLPDSVIHCEYLPFGKIFPRASAIVHHGGIGTVAQSIAAGIPQLVMPLAHDQPDNAARIERLGLGLSLPPSKYKSKAVSQKLQYLLTSQEVKMLCRRYADKVDFGLSLNEACDAIEGLLE